MLYWIFRIRWWKACEIFKMFKPFLSISINIYWFWFSLNWSNSWSSCWISFKFLNTHHQCFLSLGFWSHLFNAVVWVLVLNSFENSQIILMDLLFCFTQSLFKIANWSIEIFSYIRLIFDNLFALFEKYSIFSLNFCKFFLLNHFSLFINLIKNLIVWKSKNIFSFSKLLQMLSSRNFIPASLEKFWRS